MRNRAGPGIVALLIAAMAIGAPAVAAPGDPAIPLDAPVLDLTRSLRPYDQGQAETAEPSAANLTPGVP